MIGLIGTLLGFIIALVAIFGVLCILTGEKGNGGQIVVNCVTVLILFLAIVELFNVELPQNSFFQTGLPLLGSVDQYGSVKAVIEKAPSIFALDFVELVTLNVIINWVSNIFSLPNAGLAGKIVSKIIIVMIAILVYGAFMSVVKENVVFKWCVYSVECLITGGSVLYTPMMLISSLTGLKRKDQQEVNKFILSEFKKTNISKAISAAITSSVVFVAFLLMLERQRGSIQNVLGDAIEVFETFGAAVIMMMGIYITIKVVSKK